MADEFHFNNRYDAEAEIRAQGGVRARMTVVNVREGLVAVVISAINTALAITAWKGGRDAIPADKVVHQSH